MNPQIKTGRLHDPWFRQQVDAFFRLRYRVFHQRLGWMVQEQDGRERDAFDDAHALYLTAMNEAGQVQGGVRLRPTTAPYMLPSVFPELLHGVSPPARPDVWEVSRFAVDDHPGGTGLGSIARALVREAILLAMNQGISAYVLVVSLGMERLLRMFGLQLLRFGPPLPIGRVRSVACWLRIDSLSINVACPHQIREPAVNASGFSEDLRTRFAA